MKDTAFSTVLTQTDGPVGIVQLNRPEALKISEKSISFDSSLPFNLCQSFHSNTNPK